MNATQALPSAGFMTRLGASGRSPEIPEAADLYGWLVGSWAGFIGLSVLLGWLPLRSGLRKVAMFEL